MFLNNLDFGGATVLFGGDHWHRLPVVKKGNRVDIIEATLMNSLIWPRIQKFDSYKI